MGKKIKRLAISLASVIIVLAALVLCLEVITPGYVGVEYSPSQGVKQEVLNQGWHIISPFNTVTEYSIATEQLYLSADAREGSKTDESFDVICKDGKMKVDLEMSYSFDSEKVPDVYARYRGLSGEDIMNTVVRGKIKTKVSEVTSTYSVLDAYMNKKSELNADITKELRTYLEEFGITVESANITNAVVDPAIQTAITERSTVAQQLEVEKMNQEKARLKAETDLITAQGENAVILAKAQAEAEANKLKSQGLTSELLEKWLIEKWDGKLPVVAGENGMMLDVSKILEETPAQ